MFDKIFGRRDLKKSVLIVEDDDLLSKVLSEYLVGQGFEVAVVKNGLDVFKFVEKNKPKIILLDLILPGLDGFGVLKELKSRSVTKEIPVVVFSNLDNSGDLKSALGLGADSYFIKANMEMSEIAKYIKKRLKV